jgi:PAS domain S-box-containing protein
LVRFVGGGVVRTMTGQANRKKPSAYGHPFAACVRVLVSLALLSALARGATEPSKTVLTIYSDERLLPANIAIDTALRDTLALGTEDPPTYLSEFLDLSRFGSSTYDKLVSDLFRNKYAGQHLDVIVANGPLIFQFLRRHQADLFTGIPVVLCGVSRETFQAQTLPPNFVGVPIEIEPLPTIELALRLQPDAREIVIVTGASEFDRMWEATLRSDLPHLRTSVPIRYLNGLPLNDVLRELSRLSPNSIVYSPGLLRDGTGRTYIPRKVLRRMADASTAPMYGSYSTHIGFGIVGGYMFTMEDLGRQAAGLVKRILDGEKLSQANVPGAAPLEYVFDWNQLRRWHIPEKELPPGSVVLYRDLSAWQRYKQYIVAFACLCLVEALLIFGLLWQRARRRKVEESLVERLAFESLLSDLSTTFINLPEEQVDSNIENGLGRIAEFLNIEGITLYEFSPNRTDLTASFSWTREGISPAPTVVTTNEVPWWANHFLRGETVLASDSNELPEEASVERARFRKRGLESAASIPLKIGGELIGAMSLVSTKRRVVWTEDLVKQLRVLAEILSNALTRKRAMADLELAEAVVRESEGRFRLVANTAPVLIWMAGSDKLCTYFNKPWLDFTGRSVDLEIGNGWAEGVHSEDLRRCMDTYTQAFDRREEFRMEYRLRRHDGEYRWVLDIGVPRFNQECSFVGYIGSCIDINDHKLAEAALVNVSHKLIEAQEQERTRIARELHDDIGQRLAMFTIELERLQENSPDLPVEVRSGMGELQKQTSQIATDIQSLSHELHSSKLEYLGLAAAMRGFCKEFGEQQNLEIAFKIHDLPSPLSQDISLCLFRVLQEALHNSAKHSGVRNVEVGLWGTSDEMHLAVSDSGAGFDSEVAKENRGLGLISMEERLKLVKGTLSIESQPKRGTTIHACVPLGSGSDSMRAAG